MILRDFEQERTLARIEYLKQLIRVFELRYKGLMNTILVNHAEVSKKAVKAIQASGVEVIRKAIRGGTDGARLTFEGIPTPNIFAGGLMVHSKKEWISEIALQKAAETIVHLCRFWVG